MAALICCNRRIIHRLFHNPRPLLSQPLSSSESSPSSQDLVNNLSRVLSDYRSPQHDIESALIPFSYAISSDSVEQVLKRCKYLGFSAHRFFVWAQRLPGFKHSEDSYRILVDILGSSKQFPLIWDFLREIRDGRLCRIGREIFWNIFRAYSRANLPADAVRAFRRMVDFDLEPTVDDVDQLIHVLCKNKHVNQAQEFFDGIKDELSPTMKTYSILTRGWGDIGEPNAARNLFDDMIVKGCSIDVLAYNSVLESLCKGGNVDEAYNLFQEMRSKGIQPDAFTYSIFVHAACEANDMHSVFRVLDRMIRYNLFPNVFTCNSIVKRLCKNDKVNEACRFLDEMFERGAKPDAWSYNAILAYHCDHDEVNGALRLISRMDKDSCQPDRHTYNMVLKMLIRVGRFDRVEQVWESMESRGFYPSVSTYSVMVHGLCKKKGKLEEACKYFEMMIDEGIPPYTSTCELLRNRLIGFGFSEHREILVDKMRRSTSCSIQELSEIMRSSKGSPRLKVEENLFIDGSDDA